MDAKPLVLGWALSVLVVGASALWLGGRLLGDSTVHAEPRGTTPTTITYVPTGADTGAPAGVYIPDDMLAPLVVELRGIRAELNALRMSSTDRQPATSADSSLGAGELERLLAALEGRAQPSGSSPSATSLFVPNPNANYVDRLKAVHGRFKLASEADDENRVSREYFFKSEQEILDEFGIPAWMEAEGNSLQWSYQFQDEDEENWEIYVVFQNGRVIAVHW